MRSFYLVAILLLPSEPIEIECTPNSTKIPGFNFGHLGFEPASRDRSDLGPALATNTLLAPIPVKPAEASTAPTKSLTPAMHTASAKA